MFLGVLISVRIVTQHLTRASRIHSEGLEGTFWTTALQSKSEALKRLLVAHLSGGIRLDFKGLFHRP
jgi:hypothetical protein